MKITRKQIREMILEQLGNPSPRFNIRNKTPWQGWSSGIAIAEDAEDEEGNEDDYEEEDSESK